MKRIFALTFIYFMACALSLYAETNQKIDPVFAPQPEGLVWVEAEDAVTTNITDQATLDYASSAYRILQLNREGTAKGVPFYAEYTMVVPEDGTWNLWIGGTPPGPESDLLASFVSPIYIKVDETDPVPIHREQVAVVEKYSNTNHWFVVKQAVNLTAGVHKIRFEIRETRRYDSRYYFFLDAFFLLKSDSPLLQGTVDRNLVPRRFPLDLTNRSIDNPYLTIPQYEYAIQQNPKNKEGYLLLAQVYSLIGDHGSAIKTLSRGRIMAGEDIRFTLLAAKSRIWSGEIDEGIRLYKEYLKSPDAEKDVWAEAGKICAWLMKYQDAEDIYKQAIAKYPEDLNLKVNYALTLLWESKVRDGERYLSELWNRVKKSPDQILSLGSIYDTSGYPDKAIDAYLAGAKEHPEQIEFYLRLVRTYNKTNQSDKANEIRALIPNVYNSSDALTSVLAALDQETTLKEQVLEQYRQRLAQEPDNLDLRLELVRAYSWNGKLTEALAENQNILINKLYTILVGMDADLTDTYRLMDVLQIAKAPAAQLPLLVDERIQAIKKAQEGLKQAMIQDVQNQKSTDAAKREKSQAAVQEAQKALAKEVALAAAVNAWANGEFIQRVQSYTEEVNSSAAQIAQDAEVLNNVKPWTWLIKDDQAFLTGLAKDNPLALHGLLRINLLEGLPITIPQPEQVPLEPTKKLVLQAQLWQKQTLNEGLFSPATYYSYAGDLEDMKKHAAPAEPAEAVYSDFTNQDSEEQIKKLQETKLKAGPLVYQIDTAQKVLLRRAALRLRVRMYQYDTETQWDRQGLADLYLRLGRPADAVRTLERVLVLNPSDIASLFTLARAKEQSGDWMGALTMYKRVYDLNPRYENAAGSFNTLSVQHPQVLQTTLSASVDSNRSAETAQLSYVLPLTSFVNLQTVYTVEHQKIHTPLIQTQSLTLHTLSLKLPVTIKALGLSFYGEAGGNLQNKLDNLLPASLDDFAMDRLSDYVVVAPQLGGGLSWTGKYFSLGGTYLFHQIKDTFFADRFPNYEHQAGAFARLFLDAPNRNWFRTFSLQADGTYRSIFSPYFTNQTNNIYSVQGELHILNTLRVQPMINLDVGAIGLWENAENTVSITDYYAPDQALTIKGGFDLTAQVARSSNWTILTGAKLWSGWYSSGGSTGSLLLDSAIRLEGLRKNLTIYMNLGASRTGDVNLSSKPAYWSASLDIGARLSLADYIIP
uniref:Tetratricopeptide repeat protein n=1 Tax=Gracilinema caldarium TaxID=215591 RepID=A0A7C3IKC2_9SPIR